MNECFIIGRSGADAELRYLPNGTAVMSLSIAVNEKKQDGFETMWFKVNVFSKTAEVLSTRIKKGTEIFVKGKLVSRTYDDRKSGQKRYVVEITANRIRIIEKINAESSAYDNQPHLTGHGTLNDQDVPF